MRAWGGGSGGRWGDDDSYGEKKLRQEREGDRLRGDRKTQNGEEWTPEREQQSRWQEERSIKGGRQKSRTRSDDDHAEEQGTPRTTMSGHRASRWHDQARKDARIEHTNVRGPTLLVVLTLLTLTTLGPANNTS